MRIQFNMILAGNESLGQKFEETLKNNPNLHMDIIRAFAQSAMIAFRLNDSDNISIESFRAGKISDVAEIEDIDEKKVDN